MRATRGVLAALVTAGVAVVSAPADAGPPACTLGYAGAITSAPSPLPLGLDLRPTGNFVVYVLSHTAQGYPMCVYGSTTGCTIGLLSRIVNEVPHTGYATDYVTCISA